MKKWIQLNENNINQLNIGDKVKLIRFCPDSNGEDWYEKDLKFEIGDIFTVDAINMRKDIWLIPFNNKNIDLDTVCCNFEKINRFCMLVEDEEDIDSFSFEEIYKWLEPKIIKNIPEGKMISINSALRDIIAICYKAGYVRGKKNKSFEIKNKQHIIPESENECNSDKWSVTYINGCDWPCW